jgi:uncharacterized protein YutE (UPF0331/DUF86 family)
MVEALAMEGHVTPTEAAKLRALAKKRNQLVHGDLAVDVAREETMEFLEILKLLHGQQSATTPP